ncbi:putative anti-sigma factor Srd [Cronobacter phage vB_CsaP_GAP52]|uniref:Putative anti-sigma factor Srd n=1 Tax=Cronobacter phage vB_CsaP_GAP52 TaxID=1141137 RepID=K4F9U0_9CAUD|nr:decoy of host sigma70 [Cronobacter phage vB_CsaP_GAP52]AFC22095.1 putative anti-sigma factor Srd [Cronobacter phage vB_CsaP_GAP52]
MLTTDLEYNHIIIKMGEKIKNAGKRNILFDFTLAQFQRLFKQGTCAYSGEEFDGTGDMTIERLDPLVGYTHGNCVIVRDKLNVMRKPLDEFLREARIPDEQKVTMLELALKVAKKRVVEAGIREQQILMAKQCRANNLAKMATEMKRTRFTTVTPPNGESSEC